METIDPVYTEAKRHVKQLRGFYRHAFIFVLVIGFLTALNLMTNPGRWWFQWIAFGWGIGIIAHGLSVFVFSGVFGQDWEKRKVQEYLARRQTNRTQEMQ